MYIDEDTKQKLLDLSIEEVAEALGIRVRRHQALCLLHDDHHPSMAFMPKTNRWKCYVCNVWGNNIDLVQKYYNLNFVDSCLWLANKFNIVIDEGSVRNIKVQPRVAPVKKQPETVQIDTEILQTLIDNLSLTPAAKHFLFEERMYSSSVAESLHLCSADNDQEIMNILLARFSEQRLLQSGLAFKFKGVWKPYFNTPCLFFPYFDETGKLETLQARYLGNPEEHQRFQFPRGSKTSIFNLPILSTLKSDDTLFISEGVTDCIALLSTGKNAIAIPSASTLKPSQLETIVKRPLGMYPDNDEPGERLYSQIADLVDSHEGKLLKLQLPEGCKDYSVYYKQLVEQDDMVRNPLFHRLQKVRWQLAQENKVPVFLIATNRTLREMVEQRPQNKEALCCIYGMAAKKIEHFGDAFLEALSIKEQ